MVGRDLKLHFLFVQNALERYQRYSVRDMLTNPMKGRNYSEHFNWVCLYLCQYTSARKSLIILQEKCTYGHL